VSADIFLPIRKGAFGDHHLLLHLVARRLIERRHDAVGDVGRLVVLGIGVRDVVRQRTDRRGPRRRLRRFAFRDRGGVSTRNQPGCRGLDVALDARHLPGKQQISAMARLPGRQQHLRPADVGIAMHHAEADEFGVLETRDHLQHARLVAPFDLRLEADQAVVIAGERVLPQLDHGVGQAAGPRILQADRLHGPEPQRAFAAMGHHLDRQAPFEELGVVEVVHRGRFSGHQRGVERVVLLLRHRTIEVVTLL
jgi:hypothetical protein